MNFNKPSEKEKIQDPTHNLPLQRRSKKVFAKENKNLFASVLIKRNI